MPKKERAPVTRRHIYLFDSDWDFIMSHFDATVGASTTIREVLHTWVEGVKAKIEAQGPMTQRQANVALPPLTKQEEEDA